MVDCGSEADKHGAPSSGANEAPAEPARKFKLPTAFTVLAAVVLLLVWIASFFIPAGRYDTNAIT
jgi:uncharacterized ion transporter superfamily protein YfcC